MSWTLSDGVTTYTFAIGPNAMSLNDQRTTTYSFMPSATEKAVAMVSTNQPRSGEITGTLLTKAEYEALRGWWQSSERVTLTDDLAQPYDIVIKGFAPERVWAAEHPYKHKWTIQFDVVES